MSYLFKYIFGRRKNITVFLFKNSFNSELCNKLKFFLVDSTCIKALLTKKIMIHEVT